MTKSDLYAGIEAQLRALFAGERDLVANAANCSAVLYERLPEVNWVGFYFLRGEELVVGPFQGRPACIRIPLGSGVCGTAASDRRTTRVDDVHAFAGHIACDAASSSEIVVPLLKGERLLGVLDVDSPRRGRFDALDETGLERIAALFAEAVEPGPLIT
ncbi:MAG TPA: GAF domain-containing protein [Gammaproteobacteria bacterium]|nr:GAF domain-containing protein [Gammaproteobacteria bacterium]